VPYSKPLFLTYDNKYNTKKNRDGREFSLDINLTNRNIKLFLFAFANVILNIFLLKLIIFIEKKQTKKVQAFSTARIFPIKISSKLFSSITKLLQRKEKKSE
jgi:hypothetical protein